MDTGISGSGQFLIGNQQARWPRKLAEHTRQRLRTGLWRNWATDLDEQDFTEVI